MAQIKSAYEIAMERASNIKVDNTLIKKKGQEQKGKESASNFLNKPKFDFSKWVENLEDNEKENSIKGSMWVFIKNITLPNTTADVDRLLKIKQGILILSDKDEDINLIFTQLTTVFQQYIENSKTLLEQCKTEFAPKLQQKAMQLAQQTGQMTPIEPETDRDFIEFHRNQQEQVSNHFKEFIKQITDNLEKLV